MVVVMMINNTLSSIVVNKASMKSTRRDGKCTTRTFLYVQVRFRNYVRNCEPLVVTDSVQLGESGFE